LVEHVEQLAQPRHVGRQVSHFEQVALAGNQHGVLGVGHLGAGRHGRVHQRGHVAAQLVDLVAQAAARRTTGRRSAR
jgi:hypothetical protein